MNERVRFSPSPSGGLHLGGVRTALFNWLLARRTEGTFILRIEDTDAARVASGAAEAIAEDLRWLGLAWDEGFQVGGSHEPYVQSQRGARYADALARLRERGAVYPCFCTAETLAADRAADEAAGRAPRYHGTCAALPATERARRLAAGEPCAWRFSVPRGRVVTVGDLVHGEVSFRTDDIGDFIVARSDGAPVYDLACVVDDGEMGITTVMRGDDHLANTARQILLHEALGQTLPRWAHLPLVTAPGGAPLSKSAGAETVAELREQGFLPLAVINHAARLGWSLPSDDILSLPALAARFELEAVSRSSAVHDPARLRALDARLLRAMPSRVLVAALRPFASSLPEWLDLERLAGAVRDELVTRADLAALAAPLIEGGPLSAEGAAALCAPGARDALAAMLPALRAAEGAEGGEALTAACRAAAKGAGVAPRIALPALRAALIGQPHGLPIETVVDLLGRERMLSRVERCLRLTPSADGADSSPA